MTDSDKITILGRALALRRKGRLGTIHAVGPFVYIYGSIDDPLGNRPSATPYQFTYGELNTLITELEANRKAFWLHPPSEVPKKKPRRINHVDKIVPKMSVNSQKKEGVR